MTEQLARSEPVAALGERCADACARRGDPFVATAPPVSRWLLVEQPGPWGPDALNQSRLDGRVAGALTAAATAAGARIALIRRVRRARPASRRWAFVDARPGREAMWWAEFQDPAELLGLDLERLPEPAPTRPAYLVCAHGKHDMCCALRGRPVAAALAAARPEETWECSHVGGDRFAANVLMLPHSLYYGRVAATEVVGLAAAYEAGQVDPRWLRGRSCLTPPAQAAQHFARLRSGEHGVDSFRPKRVERVGHELWRVELDGSPPLTVRATHERSDTPLTCSATVPAPIRHFELVARS